MIFYIFESISDVNMSAAGNCCFRREASAVDAVVNASSENDYICFWFVVIICWWKSFRTIFIDFKYLADNAQTSSAVDISAWNSQTVCSYYSVFCIFQSYLSIAVDDYQSVSYRSWNCTFRVAFSSAEDAWPYKSWNEYDRVFSWVNCWFFIKTAENAELAAAEDWFENNCIIDEYARRCWRKFTIAVADKIACNSPV